MVRCPRTTAAAYLAAAVAACAPSGTPPPAPADTREIEAERAPVDADRRGPLGIPEAELPPPGECRVWHPDRRVADQRPSEPCGDAEGAAPAGGRILYRPTDDPRVVHVRVLDPADAGTVLRVDIYDAETEAYEGTYQP